MEGSKITLPPRHHSHPGYSLKTYTITDDINWNSSGVFCRGFWTRFRFLEYFQKMILLKRSGILEDIYGAVPSC